MIVTTETGADSKRRLDALDFVLALFVLALMSVLGFTGGRSASGRAAGGVRVVLGSAVAGLTGYIYYGVGGPGMAQLHAALHNLAPMFTTLIAGIVGLVYSLGNLHRADDTDDVG